MVPFFYLFLEMHWFLWNCDSSVTQRVSELDTRDFCNLNESQLFLIEFYSVPGAWVMMLLMLMVERLGLAVMTSRLVAEMGSWGQESCQSLHTSVPPASSPQGQSSLDNTSSVIRTRLVRADSSTMAIRSDQTLSHCHTSLVRSGYLHYQLHCSLLSTRVGMFPQIKCILLPGQITAREKMSVEQFLFELV